MSDWLKRVRLEPELDLNGEAVPIVLRRHPAARRLTLRLAPDGSAVKLTLPRWAAAREALAFAHARADWLAAQHARIPRRSAPEPGGVLTYRGTARRIEWKPTAPRQPRLADDAIHVGGSREGLEARLRRWLEAEALALFKGDMRDYTRAAGLETVPVSLSRAQRRWGSCSDKSRIRLNWRLVQAPDFVRRSVVAHEVAHLVHFDHSPAFHALLAAIYESEIARADRWLKDHGRTLYSSFG